MCVWVGAGSTLNLNSDLCKTYVPFVRTPHHLKMYKLYIQLLNLYIAQLNVVEKGLQHTDFTGPLVSYLM